MAISLELASPAFNHTHQQRAGQKVLAKRKWRVFNSLVLQIKAAKNPSRMNTEILSQTFGRTLGRAARNLVRCCTVGAAAAMITTPAHAAFHLWNIREVYSDASGSLQFIELFTSAGAQQSVG